MIQLSLWDTTAAPEEKKTPAVHHGSPAATGGSRVPPSDSVLRTPGREARDTNPSPPGPPMGPEPKPRFGYYLSSVVRREPGIRIPERLDRPPSPAETAFERAFRRLGMRRPMPEFRVEHRAFAGLRSTIRLRGHRAEAEVSDLLADAPPVVIEAAAEILLARLFRRSPSREARECYAEWSLSPAVRGRVHEVRRARGRKRLLPARGRYFDLQSIFDQLNQRFFGGTLSPARIGWSPVRSRTLLGHYDAAHHTITISRRFDSASVPRYLLDYLVYHEMLHIKYPEERNGHRRVVHTRAFLEAEKRFPPFEEARKRLDTMSGAEVW